MRDDSEANPAGATRVMRDTDVADQSGEESCDYCGAQALGWRQCKLVCGNCGNIVKSCADL